MDNLKKLLLEDLKGVINSDTLSKKYYKPLPEALEKWYVYTMDGGHCIFVLLNHFTERLKDNPAEFYRNNMLPVPVKTVLRSSLVNDDGIIALNKIVYSDEFGLLVPQEDIEFEYSLVSDESDDERNHVETKWKDDDVCHTTYFDSKSGTNGLFHLAYNRKCFFLFIPDKYNYIIDDLKTGEYVVLTTGYFDYYKRDMVELMFEDFSDNPYCIHISEVQLFFPIDDSLLRKKFKLKVLCRKGIVMETEIFVRSKGQYRLPYLKPIDVKNFDAA